MPRSSSWRNGKPLSTYITSSGKRPTDYSRTTESVVAVLDNPYTSEKITPNISNEHVVEVGYSPHLSNARQLRFADNPFVAFRCVPVIMTPATYSGGRVASSDSRKAKEMPPWRQGGYRWRRQMLGCQPMNPANVRTPTESNKGRMPSPSFSLAFPGHSAVLPA